MIASTLQGKKKGVPVRAGPPRADAAGACLGTIRAARKNGSPSSAPSEGHCLREDASLQGEGKRKIRVCLTSHLTQQKEVEFCGRPTLLCVVELFGGRMGSDDIESAQARPQCLPEGPSILLWHLWA